MNYKFKVGNRIRFAYAEGGGVIVQILENLSYEIEDDNGFVNTYFQTQIILDQSKPEYFTKPIKTNKDYISKIKNDKLEKVVTTSKIDLHLSNNISNLSNSEILEKQLNIFQTAINEGIMHNYKEIIVIHGIGKGTLKKAILEKILQNRFVLNYQEINEGSLKLRLKKNI